MSQTTDPLEGQPELVDPSLDENAEMTVAEMIQDCLTEYGEYALSTKFPHLVDGLKVVHRRILESLCNVRSYQKFSAALGHVMMRHPHGDGSINSAVIRLGQPWNHTIPLVDIRGNIGSYNDPEPSAPRYLDIKSAEFVHDVYYAGTSRNALRMIPDLAGGLEPEYLIPKIPMVLLTGQFGIGIGYNTSLPPLHFVRLCELTKLFILMRKTVAGAGSLVPYLTDWLKSKELTEASAELLVPSFPSPGIIANYNELVTAYRRGDWNLSVKVDGIFEITPDSITVKAVPPRNPFYERCDEIAAGIRVNNSWANQHFQHAHQRSVERKRTKEGISFNRVSADFIFNLRRNVNPFDILETFKQQLQFSGSWSPNIVGLDLDNKARTCTPLEAIEFWYIARHRAALAELRHTESSLVQTISRLSAQLTIKDHTDEVIAIIRREGTREERIRNLCRRFRLTPNQAEFLIGLKLEYLSKTDQETLAKEREAAQTKLEKLRYAFSRIDDRMIEEIDRLKEKYEGTIQEACRIPNYAGALVTKRGVIQFWDEAEMFKLLVAWNKHDVDLVWYTSRDAAMATTPVGYQTSLDDALPKDIPTTHFRVIPRDTTTMVVLREGRIFRANLVQPIDTDDGTQVAYVNHRCILVDNTGVVTIDNASTPELGIPLRKLITAQGNNCNYEYVGPAYANELIVVYGSTKRPGELRVERVVTGSKLHRVPVGKTQILAVARPGDRICINIPKELQNRSGISQLIIDRVSRLVPSAGSMVTFAMRNKQFSDGSKTKRRPDTQCYMF